MRHKLFSLFLVNTLLVWLAFAADPTIAPAEDSQKASLGSLVEEVLQNNPQIQAAKQRYEAAKARVTLTRSLADPMVEYEYNKIIPGMIGNNTDPMRMFSASQEIPFPTKLFLRKQAAQKEANSFEQEYRETERKVIQELKESYFQLFLNSKKIALTKDNLELLNQFVEIANKKYSVNKASQQDSLKAQVEYSKLANQLVLLEQEKKITESMLNSLLNREEDPVIEPLEEKNNKDLELNEADIIKSAKENRPELKSFQEMLKKSGIDLTLAKQEYLPDFTVKYTRQENNGELGEWTGMAGITVPLWFGGKQNSFVKEAKANLRVAEAEYQAAENMVVFETRSAYVKFMAAKGLVNIYEAGVLPQAQSAFETAQRGYQSDQTTFLDMLDSQRSLREFQMEYFEALANLEIALADLERSIGTELRQ
jgi:outer membrane protein TolC